MKDDKKEKATETTQMINTAGNDLETLLKLVRKSKAVHSILKNWLWDHNISAADLAERAKIAESTANKILTNKLRPSRDILLRIAFVLKMNIEETQELLKSGMHAALSASSERDVIIMSGLKDKFSLEEMDDRLKEKGLTPLT